MAAIGLILGFLLAIVAAWAMWRCAHLFLSHRDYYVNSKFDLFRKRVSMSLTAGGVVLLFFVILASGLNRKPTSGNLYLNKTDTTAKATEASKGHTGKRKKKSKLRNSQVREKGSTVVDTTVQVAPLNE